MTKLDGPKRLALCGMDPARKRESRVDVAGVVAGPLKAFSRAEVEPGRNGLVDGVGLEVREVKDGKFWAVVDAVGDILDGKVPARPRLAGLLMPVSVKGTKSGKPSCVGDSGISNNGVDVPLVGGPHIFPELPVGVCSSLVLFGNNLVAWSCSGEPDPTLEPVSPANDDALLFGPANGDFTGVEGVGSTMGERPDKFRLRLASARVLSGILSVREWSIWCQLVEMALPTDSSRLCQRFGFIHRT